MLRLIIYLVYLLEKLFTMSFSVLSSETSTFTALETFKLLLQLCNVHQRDFSLLFNSFSIQKRFIRQRFQSLEAFSAVMTENYDEKSRKFKP